MKKNMWKKGLVFAIICLFIGVSVAPVISGANFKSNSYDKQAGTDNSERSENNEEVVVTVQSDGENTELTYNIGEFNFEQILIDNTEYSRVTIGSESNSMERGCPDLPNICRSIIIPDDAKMDVQVIGSNYQEYEDFLIAPSKGILPRTIDPEDVPYVFGDVYNEDKWYPEDIAELCVPYILRDFRGQVVKVNPFQYNPISKKLRVYTDITVEVFSVGPGEINVLHRLSPLTSIDRYFKSIYENHFLNFNTVRYTPVEEQGNMLVICNDSFYSAMEPFVYWKNMKGIPTEMVNLSDIGSGTADDIDSYIESYYNTNGLTFVLLIGDIDEMPSLYDGSHASDPSYSYISADNYQDLFVGRFSAQNIADLETQVNRSIEYEKYPQADTDWYHKGTGVASNEGTGDDGEYDWEHMRNIRDDLLNFTYTEVDEFYDGSHGGADADGNPSSNMVGAAIDDGRSIVNYVGHGSPTGWSTSGFSNSDINDLVNDNTLPYVVCVACNNGEFEHYDTCFAEAWMRATNSGEPTGAIAVFASTQSQSWSPPMDAQDEIVDLLVNGSYNSIGGLSFSGTMHMMDEYGSGCYGETNTWTVFGDPSLQLYTDTPVSMSVDHDQVIINSATSFDVTVTGVEDALCAISYNGELLGYAYTDSNGEATIYFDEPLEDIELVDFVVTAFNKLPYIITLDVVPPLRQPAEFETMEGVLIRYPFGISYDIIAEMSEDVEVVTIVANSGEQSYVESQYAINGVELGNCSFLIAPTDTYWTRDYGPWFIFNETAGGMEVVNFTYNRPRPDDDAIPEKYANDQGLILNFMDLVHAGGNYMTDGQGIAVSSDLVYTENPGKTPEDIDQIVAENLGIRTYHVVPDALGESIQHIDCWAKFLAPDVIMIIEVHSSHSNYDEIEAAAADFETMLSCYGTPYQVERVYSHLQEPYINSLILNNKVFVPITESAYDAAAIASYQAAMPGYEVLGFTGSWLNTDALHCRAKGIPDRGMLYIDHMPLTDQMPCDDGFLAEAEITSYCGASLAPGSPLLYWKNETVGIWNSILMDSDGDKYHAYIPSHPCGETIYYYINAEDSYGRIENHPYIGEPDPHSFYVTLVPDIWVDPLSFSFITGEGFTVSDDLTIGNDEFAGEQLDFNISCTNDSGLGWLSVNITQGILQPDTSMNISVMVDTTGLSIGSYYESIVVTSNDPDEPLITIPVDLTVVLANDVGAVLVNSPSGIKPFGLCTVNATIRNFGCMDQTDTLVNCTIYEGGIGGVVLEEDFSSVTPPAIPVGWTATHENWATANSNYAGGDPAEARFYYSPSSTDIFRLYSDSIDTTGYTSLNITFKHFVNHYATPYNLHVETSTDGSTWDPVWTISPTGDVGPEVIGIPLDASNGVGSSTFYISFTFDGYSYNIDYWYIDDINVSAEIIGNISYSAETTVDISAYAVEYVEFTPPWDAQENGIYGIKIQTLLLGDQDTSNDIALGAVEIFQDVTPPEITNVNDYPDPQGVDGWVNISCSVTDFTEVDVVNVIITGPVGFIPVNMSMIKDGGNTYYYYENYSIVGTYNYSIWANDIIGNSVTSPIYQFEIVSGTIITVDLPFNTGWNLITIPAENDYWASTLAENISGCSMVSWFDAEFQILRTHIVGVPAYDFSIQDGFGYFILVDQNSTFSASGSPLYTVSVQLYEEWNMIGWYNQYNTTASSLAENITGCSMVGWFDAEFQILRTHIVGVPAYDFDIDCGMGLFILVDEASIWNGEG